MKLNLPRNGLKWTLASAMITISCIGAPVTKEELKDLLEDSTELFYSVLSDFCYECNHFLEDLKQNKPTPSRHFAGRAGLIQRAVKALVAANGENEVLDLKDPKIRALGVQFVYRYELSKGFLNQLKLTRGNNQYRDRVAKMANRLREDLGIRAGARHRLVVGANLDVEAELKRFLIVEILYAKKKSKELLPLLPKQQAIVMEELQKKLDLALEASRKGSIRNTVALAVAAGKTISDDRLLAIGQYIRLNLEISEQAVPWERAYLMGRILGMCEVFKDLEKPKPRPIFESPALKLKRMGKKY